MPDPIVMQSVSLISYSCHRCVMFESRHGLSEVMTADQMLKTYIMKLNTRT